MPVFDPDELARWCGGEWTPRAPARIAAVQHDARTVDAGALFVALRGARFDGHAFIGQAAARGAAAALVGRARAAGVSAAIPLLVVDDPLRALGDVAAGYRRRWGRFVVGVTGSTGKTTVKDMIAAFLGTTLPTARTRGNWNNEIGLPLSLLSIPETARAAVLELGISHPGEMAPLCRVAQPDWGVITNVGPVHLEFFESVEAIAREKGALFRCLPADGVAVASLDDPCFGIVRDMAGCRVVTTSARADADYTLAGDDPRGGRCEVRERATGDRVTIVLPLAGAHHRRNLLLAVAVARGRGLAWSDIAGALNGFVPAPMRWERREIGGVTVINDAYNANPLSMRAAIDTFADLDVGGAKWLALGDMLELGGGAVDEHAGLGRFLSGRNWAGLVTVGALAAHIADGAVAAGMSADKVGAFSTADEAAAFLLAQLRPGDGVLLKASRGKRLEDMVERLAAGLDS